MAEATADAQTDREGEKEKATSLEPLFPCFSSPASRTVGPPDDRQHELDFFRVEPNAPPEDARFKDNGIGKAGVQLESELDLLSTPIARNGKRFSAQFHLNLEDEVPAPLSDSRRAGIRRASPEMKLDFLDAAISDKAGKGDKGLEWREAGSLPEVSSESKHADLKALDGAANKPPPGKEKLQDADERRQNASLERRGSCSGSPPKPRPSLEEKDPGGRQASPPSQGLLQKSTGSSLPGAPVSLERLGASREEELPSGQSEQNLRSTDEILKRLIPKRVLEEEEQPQAKKARKSVKEATLCFDLNAEFTCDTSFFETEAFVSKKKAAEARESDDAGLASTDMASANETGLLRRQEAADALDQTAHQYEGAKISEPGSASLGEEDPKTVEEARVGKPVSAEPEMEATSPKHEAGTVFTLSRKEAEMDETDPVWKEKGLSDQIVARSEDVRAHEGKELVRLKLMEDLLHEGTGENGAQPSSDPTKITSQATVPNGSGTGEDVDLGGRESLRVEGTANPSAAVEEELSPTSSEHPRFEVSGAAKGSDPVEPRTQQSPRKEPEQLPEARTLGQCSVRLQVAKQKSTGSGDRRTGEEGTEEQDSVHNEGRSLIHSNRECGGKASRASLSVERGAAEDVLGVVSGQDKESPEAPGAFEEQKECSCGARSDEGGPRLTVMVAEALCQLK
jgi:hypothetical protein